MLKLLIFICLIGVASASSFYFNIEQWPDRLKMILPDEIRRFHDGLTISDKNTLENISNQPQRENLYLNELWYENRNLYTKFVELDTKIRNKLNSMTAGGKWFVENVFTKLRNIKSHTVDAQPDPKKICRTARQLIDGFDMLSSENKWSVKRSFPEIAAALQSDRFDELTH